MIPFMDLKTQYHSIKAEIDATVIETLESAQFALGPRVAAFEEAFAAYCQTTFQCSSVCSLPSAVTALG